MQFLITKIKLGEVKGKTSSQNHLLSSEVTGVKKLILSFLDSEQRMTFFMIYTYWQHLKDSCTLNITC